MTTPTIRPLIEKFLNEHFPNDHHEIRPLGQEFIVDVGEKEEMKLSFRSCGTTIYNVVIHQNHFEAITPLFGISNYKPESSDLLNTFISRCNDNSAFNTVFNKMQLVDLSPYMAFTSDYGDGYWDIHDAELAFRLTSKHSDIKQRCIVQYAFHFTRDNKLKCMPVIALVFGKTTNDCISVCFELDQQMVYSGIVPTMIYEDFFENNNPFDFDIEIEQFVHKFLDCNILMFDKANADNIHSLIDLDGLSLDNKLELFKMVDI